MNLVVKINNNYNILGYVSFKEENGSWFIRAFVYNMAKHAHHLHLKEILEYVSLFEGNTAILYPWLLSPDVCIFKSRW